MAYLHPTFAAGHFEWLYFVTEENDSNPHWGWGVGGTACTTQYQHVEPLGNVIQ